MIPVPSEEIRQPSFHADELGFVFLWEGHLLRGIYPGAVERAKGYFASGFIDEAVRRGLFPKTWISDYENEQFGLILEHERITPVSYVSEWNFQMLKDAAQLVLEIVQVARKYGYDMQDCHPLNVLFRRNRPVYVDLGSFVPAGEGVSGWGAFQEFLCSYYYPLDLWRSGAPQVAKRMLAPHDVVPERDYWTVKSRFLRNFPGLLSGWLHLHKKGAGLVHLNKEQINAYTKDWGFLAGKALVAAKKAATCLKLSPSLQLRKYKRRILRFRLNEPAWEPEPGWAEKALIEVLNERWPDCREVTVINNLVCSFFEELLEKSPVERVYSLCEDEAWSRKEYNYYQKKDCDVHCFHFALSEREVLFRDKFPESRFASPLVLVPAFSIGKGKFSHHNAVVLLERLMLYSTWKTLVLMIVDDDLTFADDLSKWFDVELWPGPYESDNLLIIKDKRK